MSFQKKTPGKVTLKSRKKRTESSRKWLIRQLNDPFAQKAKEEGYRSRAAYKLIEINEKFKIIKKGDSVVDLGAAPGGWTQVCVDLVGPKGQVIGLDLQPMEPVEGAVIFEGDFTEEEVEERVIESLGGLVDVVLSDMAAPACGIASVDHIRIMNLLELVYEFSLKTLKPGGHMAAKVLRGGTENQLLNKLKKSFKTVAHFKPNSSRADSSEMYLVALGFKG
jgi:23S rRNA (uridine2552-2'-O)-methyltransferase